MRTAGDVAKALELERTVADTRGVQMANSSELKMVARRYKAAGSLAVSAARAIVGLPTAGRWA
jgi:hypothetical protein